MNCFSALIHWLLTTSEIGQMEFCRPSCEENSLSRRLVLTRIAAIIRKTGETHLAGYKLSLDYQNLHPLIFHQETLCSGLRVSEEWYLFFYWNVAIRKHSLFPSIIQRSLQKRQKLTVQIYWNYHSLQHLLQCIIDIQQWHWRSAGSICLPLYRRALEGKTFPMDFLFLMLSQNGYRIGMTSGQL